MSASSSSSSSSREGPPAPAAPGAGASSAAAASAGGWGRASPAAEIASYGIPPVSPLKRWLLTWPMILVLWGHLAWFVLAVLGQLPKPVTRGPGTAIDDDWRMIVLPALFVPTTVVCAYCLWVGWKFFERN